MTKDVFVAQVDGKERSGAAISTRHLTEEFGSFEPRRMAAYRGSCSPGMDLSRLGIYGGSAGGQNAMRALLNLPPALIPTRLRCVVDCSCDDTRMAPVGMDYR